MDAVVHRHRPQEGEERGQPEEAGVNEPRVKAVGELKPDEQHVAGAEAQSPEVCVVAEA